MSLQTTVNRAFTTGFAGQLSAFGPSRAKPARISSATVGVDPAASTNRMSRAFGYSGEVASPSAGAARIATVAVGAAVFFGILGHPQHHALNGVAGDSLGATMDLPIGTEAEFFDMATGLIVELFNETTAAKTCNFGDQLAFAPVGITVGNNPQALPLGALISVAAGAAAPAGFTLIPNARIQNTSTIGASSVGAPVSALSIVQLTQ